MQRLFRLPLRVLSWVHHQVDVTILFALAVALGMLAYVSYLASARNSAGELWVIVQQTWLVILILTLPYLAARALVWYDLLRELDIQVPIGQMIVSFAGGEITKSLPAGIYVQNYLLKKLANFGQLSLVRSSMATTAMLGLESLLAVPVALVVGLPGEEWVRYAILGFTLAWVVILMVAFSLIHYWRVHLRSGAPRWLCRALILAEEGMAAGAELINWRTARNLLPTAIYMLIYAVDLHLIIKATGVTSVSFLDAMGMYSVMVLAIVLVPIPTEIGIAEFAGLGTLLAYGIARPTAALVVLGLRLLATGMTIIVAGVVLVIMRHELASLPKEERVPSMPREQHLT
ncbi:MAG: lysylphosphatidylglycerol synthase domain-containing protein [Chloroflexota bacterium]